MALRQSQDRLILNGAVLLVSYYPSKLSYFETSPGSARARSSAYSNAGVHLPSCWCPTGRRTPVIPENARDHADLEEVSYLSDQDQKEKTKRVKPHAETNSSHFSEISEILGI